MGPIGWRRSPRRRSATRCLRGRRFDAAGKFGMARTGTMVAWRGAEPAQTHMPAVSMPGGAIAHSSCRALAGDCHDNAHVPGFRDINLPASAIGVLQRKTVERFAGHAAKIDPGIAIGQARVSDRQRLVEARVRRVMDLDALPRLVRKQRRELGPCRLGSRRPIGQHGVALPRAMHGIELVLRERSAVDGCHPKNAGRLGTIRAQAQNGLAALVAADRQVRPRCPARQEFYPTSPSSTMGTRSSENPAGSE